MSNKTANYYALVFNKINDEIKLYLDIGKKYQIKELNSDFEVAMSSGCRQIYPQVTVKYCIWHQLRAKEHNKNKLCKDDINRDDELFVLYNVICNLYICVQNMSI